MKYVYVLQMVIETEDEVKMEIDSVYTTHEKADAMGKHFVETIKEYIGHYVSRHIIYQ